MHRLGTAARHQPPGPGFREAAPEGEGGAPQVHTEAEQGGIAAAITAAAEQIHVMAPAGVIPWPSPGRGARFHQGNQRGHKLGLG